MPALITPEFAKAVLRSLDLDPEAIDPEQLAAMIAAASEAIQRHCGDRLFVLGTHDERLEVEWDGTVLLRQIPVTTIERVEAPSGEELTAYDLDERLGLLTLVGRRWGRVRIVYEAGFDPVPGPVQQACALLVADWLNPVNPRLASESAGAYSYTLDTALSAFAMTPTVQGLIAPYRLHHA